MAYAPTDLTAYFESQDMSDFDQELFLTTPLSRERIGVDDSLHPAEEDQKDDDFYAVSSGGKSLNPHLAPTVPAGGMSLHPHLTPTAPSGGKSLHPNLTPAVPSTGGKSLHPHLPSAVPPTGGKSLHPHQAPNVPSTGGKSLQPHSPPAVPSTGGKSLYPHLAPTVSSGGKSVQPHLPPAVPSGGKSVHPHLPPSVPCGGGKSLYTRLTPGTPSGGGKSSHPHAPPAVQSQATSIQWSPKVPLVNAQSSTNVVSQQNDDLLCCVLEAVKRIDEKVTLGTNIFKDFRTEIDEVKCYLRQIQQSMDGSSTPKDKGTAATDLSGTCQTTSTTSHSSSSVLPADLRPVTENTPSLAITSDGSNAKTNHAAGAPSSRSSGPSDVISGMLPGAGANRLLPLQRISLPKGEVNGLAYSCEARCGYSDDASTTMMCCDSNFHKRQPRLKVSGKEKSERGWYHPACGGLTSGEVPNPWICPSCLRKGRTSTDLDNSDDEEEGEEGDKDVSPDDSSEDDYAPDRDTPDEDSDDDDDDNDAQSDSHHEESKTRRNSVKIKIEDTSEQYDTIAAHNDENTNPDDEEEEEVYGIEDYMDEPKSQEYILSDENSPSPPPMQTQAKTKKGDPWSETEKELAMDFMGDIVKEGNFFGEDRFFETSRRMRVNGYDRNWASVKNAWNRGLRERSGIDERKNKRAPLTTSKQDAASKREREERRKQEEMRKQEEGSSPSTKSQPSRPPQPRRSPTAQSQRPNGKAQKSKAKSVSPKRNHEPDDDEDEVIPPKRRRSSPYDADRFYGLA